MKSESNNSPFTKLLNSWPEERIRELMNRAAPGDVARALGREGLQPEDLAALLSPEDKSTIFSFLEFYPWQCHEGRRRTAATVTHEQGQGLFCSATSAIPMRNFLDIKIVSGKTSPVPRRNKSGAISLNTGGDGTPVFLTVPCLPAKVG